MGKFVYLRIASFKFAFQGLIHVIRTQKNSWIHLIATCFCFFLAWTLKSPATHWAILIFTIILVWLMEIINTTVELLVDLISPQRQPQAKIIKDVSAAAVLVAAIASVMIGIILFGPPLLHLLAQLLK